MKANSMSTSMEGNSTSVSNVTRSSGSGSGSGSGYDRGSADDSPINTTAATSDDMTYQYTTPDITDKTELYDFKNISIHLPPTLFENVNDTNVGVLFTFYTGPALFPVRRDYDDNFPEVVSPVIGASLAQLQPQVNLTTNVTMTLPFAKVSITTGCLPCSLYSFFLQLLKQSNLSSLDTAIVCASWNFSAAGMYNLCTL